MTRHPEHSPRTRRDMLEAFPDIVEAYKAKNQVILIINRKMCATGSRRYDSRTYAGWRKEIDWLKKVTKQTDRYLTPKETRA